MVITATTVSTTVLQENVIGSSQIYKCKGEASNFSFIFSFIIQK